MKTINRWLNHKYCFCWGPDIAESKVCINRSHVHFPCKLLCLCPICCCVFMLKRQFMSVTYVRIRMCCTKIPLCTVVHLLQHQIKRPWLLVWCALCRTWGQHSLVFGRHFIFDSIDQEASRSRMLTNISSSGYMLAIFPPCVVCHLNYFWKNRVTTTGISNGSSLNRARTVKFLVWWRP